MIKDKILRLAVQFINKSYEECLKINHKNSQPIKKREFESAYRLSRVILEIEAIKKGKIIEVENGWRIKV